MESVYIVPVARGFLQSAFSGFGFHREGTDEAYLRAYLAGLLDGDTIAKYELFDNDVSLTSVRMKLVLHSLADHHQTAVNDTLVKTYHATKLEK